MPNIRNNNFTSIDYRKKNKQTNFGEKGTDGSSHLRKIHLLISYPKLKKKTNMYRLEENRTGQGGWEREENTENHRLGGSWEGKMVYLFINSFLPKHPKPTALYTSLSFSLSFSFTLSTIIYMECIY